MAKQRTDEEILQNIKNRYGKENHITRVPLPRNGEVLLERLASNQSVCMGDGKTYYFVLTEKEKK